MLILGGTNGYDDLYHRTNRKALMAALLIQIAQKHAADREGVWERYVVNLKYY